jgi:hypothetical protein
MMLKNEKTSDVWNSTGANIGVLPRSKISKKFLFLKSSVSSTPKW